MIPHAILLIVSIWMLFGTPTRRWPDGHGGIVRGPMVLERTDDVIIMVSETSRLYRPIPKDALRDLDRRYLSRMKGRAESFTFNFDGVPDDLKKIASIEDGASLLDACSAFHSMDKQQVVETLRKYLSLCEHDERFDPDNIWFLAPLIFERSTPPYPDFGDPGLRLTEPSWPTSRCINFQILSELPFFGPTAYGHSGPCWPDTALLMTWFERYGEKKIKWMRPISLPTDVLDALGADNTALRSQAWQMVSHLFDTEWDLVYAQPIHDERWKQLSEMLATLEVEWDSQTLMEEPCLAPTTPTTLRPLVLLVTAVSLYLGGWLYQHLAKATVRYHHQDDVNEHIHMILQMQNQVMSINAISRSLNEQNVSCLAATGWNPALVQTIVSTYGDAFS